MLRDANIRDQKARVSNKALHEARHARCQRRFPVAALWIETCTGSKPARVGRIEANPRLSANDQEVIGSTRRLSHLLHRDIMSPCRQSSWKALTQSLPRKSLRLIVADSRLLEPSVSASILSSAARDKSSCPLDKFAPQDVAGTSVDRMGPRRTREEQ